MPVRGGGEGARSGTFRLPLPCLSLLAGVTLPVLQWSIARAGGISGRASATLANAPPATSSPTRVFIEPAPWLPTSTRGGATSVSVVANAASLTRLREDPQWKLLNADLAPCILAIFEALFAQSDTAHPSTRFHEDVKAALEDLQQQGEPMTRTAQAVELVQPRPEHGFVLHERRPQQGLPLRVDGRTEEQAHKDAASRHGQLTRVAVKGGE